MSAQTDLMAALLNGEASRVGLREMTTGDLAIAYSLSVQAADVVSRDPSVTVTDLLRAHRDGFVSAASRTARIVALTEFRQLVVDLMDVCEQTPEGSALARTLDAFDMITKEIVR